MFYRFKQKNLHLDVVFAKNQCGKNILKLSGLPGFPREDVFTDYCAMSGFNVFIPHYYGSWLSGGIFTPNNCLKTIKDSVNFIKQEKATELYNYKIKNWINKELIICGSSFGGYMALKYCALSKIHKCALFSPLIDIKNQGLSDNEEKLIHTLKFIREVFENGFRGINQKGWNNFFSGKSDISKIQLTKLTNKSFFICHGVNDPTINIEHTRMFVKKIPNVKYFEIENANHKTRDYLTEDILNNFKIWVLK